MTGTGCYTWKGVDSYVFYMECVYGILETNLNQNEFQKFFKPSIKIKVLKNNFTNLINYFGRARTYIQRQVFGSFKISKL